MNISLNNIGKKFNREWIFRRLNLEINPGDKLLIQGGNGSGKSTLLQIISGYVTPNEGTMTYKINNVDLASEKIKDQVSFASPYLQLPEDFTAVELIDHLTHFKKFTGSLKPAELLEKIQLQSAGNKYIKQYSSGMKQRLKLGLAILADTPVLLLDEPLSNLDKSGAVWYRLMIDNHAKNKTIVVCSNAIEEEYYFTKTSLNVMEYK